MFTAGAFFQEVVAEVRDTVEPLPEQSINLGHFGVDETDTTWYLEYRYRISERWGLVALAHNFASQGTIGVQHEFNFDGVVFPVGVNVHTEIDVDTYLVDLIYHAYRSNRSEIAIGVGIHAFNFEVEIATRTITGMSQQSATAADDDLLAPLPNLRLQGFYAITPRVALIGSTGWLSANIGEWNGDYVYLNARLHYLLTDRLGISLGYQFTDVDVERERTKQSSEYDIEFKGPTLTVSYGF
jgi:hypothetical protein